VDNIHRIKHGIVQSIKLLVTGQTAGFGCHNGRTFSLCHCPQIGSGTQIGHGHHTLFPQRLIKRSTNLIINPNLTTVKNFRSVIHSSTGLLGVVLKSTETNLPS
jgi:hypothetical protein